MTAAVCYHKACLPACLAGCGTGVAPYATGWVPAPYRCPLWQRLTWRRAWSACDALNCSFLTWLCSFCSAFRFPSSRLRIVSSSDTCRQPHRTPSARGLYVSHVLRNAILCDKTHAQLRHMPEAAARPLHDHHHVMTIAGAFDERMQCSCVTRRGVLTAPLLGLLPPPLPPSCPGGQTAPPAAASAPLAACAQPRGASCR